MTKFEYEILVGRRDEQVSSGVIWYRSSDLSLSLGPNLPKILNDMGQLGWDIAGMGDLGFDQTTEIIMKRSYDH